MHSRTRSGARNSLIHQWLALACDPELHAGQNFQTRPDPTCVSKFESLDHLDPIRPDPWVGSKIVQLWCDRLWCMDCVEIWYVSAVSFSESAELLNTLQIKYKWARDWAIFLNFSKLLGYYVGFYGSAETASLLNRDRRAGGMDARGNAFIIIMYIRFFCFS